MMFTEQTRVCLEPSASLTPGCAPSHGLWESFHNAWLIVPISHHQTGCRLAPQMGPQASWSPSLSVLVPGCFLLQCLSGYWLFSIWPKVDEPSREKGEEEVGCSQGAHSAYVIFFPVLGIASENVLIWKMLGKKNLKNHYRHAWSRDRGTLSDTVKVVSCSYYVILTHYDSRK